MLWFFVPFANLYKPYLEMRELWNFAHGQTPHENGWVVPLWWASALLSNIFGVITTVLAETNGQPNQPAVMLEEAVTVL